MTQRIPTEADLNSSLPHKEASPWKDVPLEDWRDWNWQMRNRIDTAEALARILPLSEKEKTGITRGLELFKFAIPPYYASLINPADPDCPIRRQAVPGQAPQGDRDRQRQRPIGGDHRQVHGQDLAPFHSQRSQDAHLPRPLKDGHQQRVGGEGLTAEGRRRAPAEQQRRHHQERQPQPQQRNRFPPTSFTF